MIELAKQLSAFDAKEIEDFREGRILLIDKPLTWTSFNVVSKIRVMLRANLGIRKIKVGHAGTLDPLATGLLIICIGKATKRIEELMNGEKEYVAEVTFGGTTPSYDLETEINEEFETNHINKELIIEKLKLFEGEQMQRPPIFSAIRIDGKRGYNYARGGEQDVEIPERKIFIKEIELINYENETATIRVICSKGTYIRSLANDIGKALNSGAHLSGLRRTANDNIKISDAASIEAFQNHLEKLKV